MLKIACVLTAALCALSAAPAMGASRDKIIQDCADDGRLQGKYTKSELRDARQNMPSDVAEYTDCADVLRRAELPDRGSGGGGGAGATGGGTGGPTAAAASGGGGSELLTPSSDAERKQLKKAASSGAQPVEVNGAKVVPGASGMSPTAKQNGIPGTLVAVLLLLALGTVAALIPAVRRGGLRRLFPGGRA
jgi:hypothetical protein